MYCKIQNMQFKKTHCYLWNIIKTKKACKNWSKNYWKYKIKTFEQEYIFRNIETYGIFSSFFYKLCINRKKIQRLCLLVLLRCKKKLFVILWALKKYNVNVRTTFTTEQWLNTYYFDQNLNEISTIACTIKEIIAQFNNCIIKLYYFHIFVPSKYNG